MFAWRVVGAVAGLLALVPCGWGQTYDLSEPVKPGDCVQVQIDLKLSGELRVQRDGRMAPIPLKAAATHVFPERVLAVGRSGLIEKTARVYETAKASITTGSIRTDRSLRPERQLVVAQRHEDKPLVYCPAGPLTRGELDLVSEHFDTLALPGLLPGKIVAVGATWDLSNSAVQALCNFEGLTEQKVTGKLESVNGTTANFSVTGTASGIDGGALVKLSIQATGRFDTGARRILSLEWKQKDERQQGPVSPTTVVESTTTLLRKPIDRPASLSDVALVSVPPDWAPPATMLQLSQRDAAGQFTLLHAREWRLVAETKDHTVLRLMDRGDFVAQVTVTPWTKAGKGKHLTPEEFKTAMNEASGWRPEKALQEGEVPSEGRWVYRYSVQGELEGVAVLQSFYLLAAPTGEQVVVTFTMTPKQVDKLGARDLTFIGSLEVPAR